MSKDKKPGQRIYRLPPCPSYDVEGMESWLTDMAKEGFLLEKEGFTAGIATFEYGESQYVKYRLAAAQKNTSMWAENGGEPNLEQIEISEKYSWSYVAKRGNFYIYRSFDPAARELNTDPEVQALALNILRKNRIGTFLRLLFWLALYPFLLSKGEVLSGIISMGSWLFLLFAVLVLWQVTDEIMALFSLGKLQKKLRSEGVLPIGKNWRKGMLSYHGKRAVKVILAVFLVCMCFATWSKNVMHENEVLLDNYSGTLPFATIEDLAGKGAYDYSPQGIFKETDSAREWSDWLVPRCIDYDEHASVRLSDGRLIGGGLKIKYFEANNSWIADCLANEIYHSDKLRKGFMTLDEPEIEADYFAAYHDELDFPTVIIREDNIVIRVSFYQASSKYTMPLEEWAKIEADRIMN